MTLNLIYRTSWAQTQNGKVLLEHIQQSLSDLLSSPGIAAPGKGKHSLYGTYPGTSFHRVNCEKGLCYEEFPAWEIMNYHASQVTRMSDYLLGEGAYPIHTLLGFGMNHHMWPRPDRMEKAFEGLDFIVNSDIYMTDTCRYADIILPVVTSQEREQIQIVGKGNVTLFPLVISAPGEARTDMDILLGLAHRGKKVYVLCRNHHLLSGHLLYWLHPGYLPVF